MTQSPDSRYAFYLIPPFSVSQPVAEVHQMLNKQFGFAAAARFQVHATIKGFFKKADMPLDLLIERLEKVMATQRPFPVHFNGYQIDDIGIGLNISQLNGQTNPVMKTFREQIVNAVRPFIAPDCDFVEADLGEPFKAHITLAFRDIPLALYDDVLAWLEESPLPTEPFTAQTFHFLQFFSDDWDANWWDSLTWRLLKSWHMHK